VNSDFATVKLISCSAATVPKRLHKLPTSIISFIVFTAPSSSADHVVFHTENAADRGAQKLSSSIIQCEGQNAKITGFEVPRKRKFYSFSEPRAAFQEELHLSPAERMLVPLFVCAFPSIGKYAGACRQEV
ncbi:MAG TPA: hypothetical protein VFJ52_00480, partial [Terriglobia bacterium]|nr:hypothetical protein [Terriglobia bacterium]